ncbi:MAG: ATP-binding cassette domain-containing protein, partial [Lachnospiraceae bacterium]|nr:ATP-binding cassette domain-containing protein [Lachnospiraceae bacterium]
IMRTAESYGFKAQGYRLEPEQLRELHGYPCILHWEFSHFLVLTGFFGDMVCLNDPARGEIMVSAEEFDSCFTGVCIAIEPGEEFEPSGKPRKVWDFVKKRLDYTRTSILFVAITSFILSVCTIITTALSRFFMDYLLPGNNPEFLMPFIQLLLFVTLIQISVSWLKAVFSFRINGKFATISNATYFRHVLRLPMSFFSHHMIGDIEQRRNDNAAVSDVLINVMTPIYLDGIMMLAYFVVLFRHSPLLSFVGLLAIVIDFGIAWYVSQQRINMTRLLIKDRAKLISTTISCIGMIETIKANGAENSFFGRWAGFQAGTNTQNVHYVKLNSFLGKIPDLLINLVNDLIMVVGVYLVMKGNFTPGIVLAFQGLMMQFMKPAKTFIAAGQSIQEMKTDIERIEDVMDFPEDELILKGESVEPPSEYRKLSGEMEIRNVTFGYGKLSAPNIVDFNLKLEAGKSVAIVGMSGSGKSTVCGLIAGLYIPWEGEILFDGKPIGEIDRNTLKGSVGVVDQNPILFDDTVENNIKMWNPAIENYEMVLAARDACVHDEIMHFPNGYQYMLSEGGRNLSGGQKQRLELARVLAADPTLLILDESTSSLDARMEHEIMKAIKNRGIACVIIAHRINAIKYCDEIIYMDHGKILERGTHEELMKIENGAYRTLVLSE